MKQKIEMIICVLIGIFMIWIAYVSYKIGMVR